MIYDNIIKNEKIWSELKAMVANKKLPHAMLFHGPDVTGKEAHAIALAAHLNNYQNKTDFAKIMNFQHPNINLIIPLPREKAINKNTDSLKSLSEKSLEQLINMKKEKMINPYQNIFFELTQLQLKAPY